ncbi:MAG: hypothetical protein M1832_002139 [Thelocarpon impressellum]|nr:MAG: hypothetical protein M1832_002139 [Thelocarpon impressellum]
MATFSKCTFPHASYAAFRPTYPPALYTSLLEYHHGPRQLAVDLGSGHGLVARSLAPSFAQVIGTDPSPGMVEEARRSTSASNVSFREASAESLPFVSDGQADMVAAAQAAHWFEYPMVWSEMARILRKEGTLVFWGYKDHAFVDYPKASEILHRYTYGEGPDLMGDYWSQPGRAMVQNKYHDIQPPGEYFDDVRRIEYEPSRGRHAGEGTLMLEKRMTLGACKEYIRTWSAYHGWCEAHPAAKRSEQGGAGDVADAMFEEMVREEADWQQAEPSWRELEVDVEWGSAMLLATRR